MQENTRIFNKVKCYLDTSDGPLSDDQISVLRKHGGWVAGGAISSIVTGREVRDVDVYFPNAAAAEAFLDVSQPLSISDKAILLVPKEGMPPVQMIYDRFYESPGDIFEAFDFSVCMGAFSFQSAQLLVDNDFVSDNLSRNLRFNSNTLYPLMSFLRVSKYGEYGYEISTLEKLKMLVSISKLDISSKEELERQIGGMYGSHLELHGVESIEDFLNLDSDIDWLVTKGNVPNQSSEDIYEKFYSETHDIPSGLFWKSVDENFMSMMCPANLKIDYTPGSTITTSNLPGDKCIYLHKLTQSGFNSYASWGGEHRVVLLQSDNAQSPKADHVFRAGDAYEGTFTVIGECSSEGWFDMAISDRVEFSNNLLKEIL